MNASLDIESALKADERRLAQWGRALAEVRAPWQAERVVRAILAELRALSGPRIGALEYNAAWLIAEHLPIFPDRLLEERLAAHPATALYWLLNPGLTDAQAEIVIRWAMEQVEEEVPREERVSCFAGYALREALRSAYVNEQRSPVERLHRRLQEVVGQCERQQAEGDFDVGSNAAQNLRVISAALSGCPWLPENVLFDLAGEALPYLENDEVEEVLLHPRATAEHWERALECARGEQRELVVGVLRQMPAARQEPALRRALLAAAEDPAVLQSLCLEAGEETRLLFHALVRQDAVGALELLESPEFSGRSLLLAEDLAPLFQSPESEVRLAAMAAAAALEEAPPYDPAIQRSWRERYESPSG